MRRVAVLTLSALLAVPVAGAARTREAPWFAFGRSGGNIAPFRVEIHADGTLHHSGAVRLARPADPVSKQRLDALLRLARTQSFWSLPRVIRCAGSLPDYAYLFVTVGTATSTRTVKVRGGCRARFARVFAGLEAAAGVLR